MKDAALQANASPLSLVAEAADFATNRFKQFGSFAEPRLAIVTGSGLGDLARVAPELGAIDYAEIPGLGAAHVAGHAGRLLLLDGGRAPVLCFVGRRHLYEGIEPGQAAFIARLIARLGAGAIILTNAAGGLAPRLYPGDLMLIADHLNLMFRNPLIGRHDAAQGDRFPDMSAPYDEELSSKLREAAREESIRLHEGTYAALTGPAYETRAEVAMLRAMGGDAVGMSTVPEVLAARQAGLRVAAISLITNSHVHPAAPPTHEEVLATAASAAERLRRLIAHLIVNFSV